MSISPRGLVVFIIVVGLLVSVGSILLHNAHTDGRAVLLQIIRVAVILALSFFLYRRRSWARYLLALLFGLGAISAGVGGLTLLGAELVALPLLVLAAVYGGCMVVLLLSPGVSTYIEKG